MLHPDNSLGCGVEYGTRDPDAHDTIGVPSGGVPEVAATQDSSKGEDMQGAPGATSSRLANRLAAVTGPCYVR